MGRTVVVRCSPEARDRIAALAAETKRPAAGVLEILSHARVGDLVDLIAGAAARGELIREPDGPARGAAA